MKEATYMPLALVMALALTNLAHAEMYKWTDSRGETHYTETPPPADAKGKDIEAEIKLSSGTPSNTGNTETVAKQDQATDAPPEETTKPTETETTQNTEEQHRQFCTQQENAEKQLSSNSLVKWQDEKGEHFLTAAEKASKIQEIKKNLETMCRPEMFSTQKAAGDE